jgi:2-dehydropantoate 2-reductase
MRFIIYGAGGIGCAIGGHLALSGYNVVLIGRSRHVKQINKHGLKFITPSGTYVLNIPSVTNPRQIEFDNDDILFFCMKGQDTERALLDIVNLIEDLPIYCFQNGIRNEEIVSGYYPRVFGVMVRVGAVYLKAGDTIVRRDPPGWFIIGRYPWGISKEIDNVTEALKTAGFFVRTSKDVMQYKWGKLMGNIGNVVYAITNKTGNQVADIILSAQDEFKEILAKANINWISQEAVSRDWPEISAPLKGSLDNPALSSTWQSLSREQGSVETEFLNGEAVRQAAKIGHQAPINKKLLQICNKMAEQHEIPGKYTPAELRDLLGLKSTR